MALPDFPINLPWEGPPVPKGDGVRDFESTGRYKGSASDEMEMARRLETYVEDERKATEDYFKESELADLIGRPDIAMTLKVMSENEHRHYTNLQKMLKDLRWY